MLFAHADLVDGILESAVGRKRDLRNIRQFDFYIVAAICMYRSLVFLRLGKQERREDGVRARQMQGSE